MKGTSLGSRSPKFLRRFERGLVFWQPSRHFAARNATPPYKGNARSALADVTARRAGLYS